MKLERDDRAAAEKKEKERKEAEQRAREKREELRQAEIEKESERRVVAAEIAAGRLEVKQMEDGTLVAMGGVVAVVSGVAVVSSRAYFATVTVAVAVTFCPAKLTATVPSPTCPAVASTRPDGLTVPARPSRWGALTAEHQELPPTAHHDICVRR